MEHLTALDATFLEVEDSDPHVSLAVGGLSIVEGPAPSYDDDFHPAGRIGPAKPERSWHQPPL